MLARTARRFCTASGANASLKTAAAECWDALIDIEWVDEEEPLPEIKQAEAVIDEYRAVYDGTQDDLYEQMRSLYHVKEAARLTQLYEAHIFMLTKDHQSMVGWLGNDVKMPEGAEKPALDTIKEYSQFVNSIENDRIARKVEAQLGRKIIHVRQVLSIPNFSVHYGTVANDHIVVNKN